MDIRLKTVPLDFDGRHYDLAVNMNVLADVQEMNGGNLGAALTGKRLTRSVLQFLTAAVNDAADAQGLDVRYTERQVGRMLTPAQFDAVRDGMMELVVLALSGDDSEDDEKNAEATRS